MTTFLQNLEPLLSAAEKYAELTRQRNQSDYPIDEKLGELILEQKTAADALLAAAVEFAKWGKPTK